MLLRGVGTPRHFPQPNASVQWRPDGLPIRINKWFLEAGFRGAPPISLSLRAWAPAFREALGRQTFSGRWAFSTERACSSLQEASGYRRASGLCFWKGKRVGGSMGKVGSFGLILLPHVIGQVSYGRGQKGKHKCWKQSLGMTARIHGAFGLPTPTKKLYIYIYNYMYVCMYVCMHICMYVYIYIYIYT